MSEQPSLPASYKQGSIWFTFHSFSISYMFLNGIICSANISYSSVLEQEWDHFERIVWVSSLFTAQGGIIICHCLEKYFLHCSCESADGCTMCQNPVIRKHYRMPLRHDLGMCYWYALEPYAGRYIFVWPPNVVIPELCGKFPTFWASINRGLTFGEMN